MIWGSIASWKTKMSRTQGSCRS